MQCARCDNVCREERLPDQKKGYIRYFCRTCNRGYLRYTRLPNAVIEDAAVLAERRTYRGIEALLILSRRHPNVALLALKRAFEKAQEREAIEW